MADLIIRGIEMPKNCLYCHFISYDNDHCVVMDKDIPIYGTKPSWCPLITLPEGHGRLVDANALMKKGIELDWSVQKWVQEVDIMTATTIVPAEGGNQ